MALVHNGIIENFQELRAELEEEGVRFATETDTEVVAHLLTRELNRRLNGMRHPALDRTFRAILGLHCDVRLGDEMNGYLAEENVASRATSFPGFKNQSRTSIRIQPTRNP